MRQSFLGDAIPLWFVFAHRIYLDIYRILREQIDRGLKELRVAKSSEGHAEELFREEFVEEDAFFKMKEQIYCEPLTGRLDRPYHLLSQHPLWCGTLLLDIRIRLQDAGIPMVNGWGSILRGAHLYNATRKERYLPTAWVDMKALVAIHSPE